MPPPLSTRSLDFAQTLVRMNTVSAHSNLELIDFARDSNPGRTLRGYATQARAPLFDTAPFELRGRPTGDGRGGELWAVTPEGTVAMSAEVELA